MIIGIMSDSHDNLPNIKKALDLFNKHNVEVIIHAGDLISPFCLKLFEAYKNKFYLCAGNNLGDEAVIKAIMTELGVYFGDVGEFTLDGKKFALYHGTDEMKLNSLVYSNKNYAYVITGHTHKKLLNRVNGLYLINPGETFNLHDNPTVAILDTKTNKVSFHSLN